MKDGQQDQLIVITEEISSTKKSKKKSKQQSPKAPKELQQLAQDIKKINSKIDEKIHDYFQPTSEQDYQKPTQQAARQSFCQAINQTLTKETQVNQGQINLIHYPNDNSDEAIIIDEEIDVTLDGWMLSFPTQEAAEKFCQQHPYVQALELTQPIRCNVYYNDINNMPDSRRCYIIKLEQLQLRQLLMWPALEEVLLRDQQYQELLDLNQKLSALKEQQKNKIKAFSQKDKTAPKEDKTALIEQVLSEFISQLQHEKDPMSRNYYISFENSLSSHTEDKIIALNLLHQRITIEELDDHLVIDADNRIYSKSAAQQWQKQHNNKFISPFRTGQQEIELLSISAWLQQQKVPQEALQEKFLQKLHSTLLSIYYRPLKMAITKKNTNAIEKFLSQNFINREVIKLLGLFKIAEQISEKEQTDYVKRLQVKVYQASVTQKKLVALANTLNNMPGNASHIESEIVPDNCINSINDFIKLFKLLSEQAQITFLSSEVSQQKIATHINEQNISQFLDTLSEQAQTVFLSSKAGQQKIADGINELNILQFSSTFSEQVQIAFLNSEVGQQKTAGCINEQNILQFFGTLSAQAQIAFLNSEVGQQKFATQINEQNILQFSSAFSEPVQIAFLNSEVGQQKIAGYITEQNIFQFLGTLSAQAQTAFLSSKAEQQKSADGINEQNILQLHRIRKNKAAQIIRQSIDPSNNSACGISLQMFISAYDCFQKNFEHDTVAARHANALLIYLGHFIDTKTFPIIEKDKQNFINAMSYFATTYSKDHHANVLVNSTIFMLGFLGAGSFLAVGTGGFACCFALASFPLVIALSPLIATAVAAPLFFTMTTIASSVGFFSHKKNYADVKALAESNAILAQLSKPTDKVDAATTLVM